MRFRFTIRDLLWLTIVFALATGWSVDSCRQQQDRRRQDQIIAIQNGIEDRQHKQMNSLVDSQAIAAKVIAHLHQSLEAERNKNADLMKATNGTPEKVE